MKWKVYAVDSIKYTKIFDMKLVRLGSAGQDHEVITDANVSVAASESLGFGDEGDGQGVAELFDSPVVGDLHCYAACLRREIQQIAVFDVYLDANRYKYALPTNQVNFSNEVSDDLRVLISHDCQMIFFSNQDESFIIEQYKGYKAQRKLRQLKGKSVRHVAEDRSDEDRGFFVVVCEPYDVSLDVQHTHRQNFKVDFKREVEPGIIKIFDFHIQREAADEDGFVQNHLRLAGNREDEFIVDRADYKEKKISESEARSTSEDPEGTDEPGADSGVYEMDLAFERRQSKSRYHHFIQKDVHCCKYNEDVVSAFSINWPYVAFAGLENLLVIVNAFDKELVHRFQLAPPGVNMQIKQTYISDTQDVYALVYMNEKLNLFHMDLDRWDVRNFDGCEDDLNDLYKI